MIEIVIIISKISFFQLKVKMVMNNSSNINNEQMVLQNI